MRRLADFAGKELKWSQPIALRMEYELRAGDELAALLRFPSSFSSYAKAEGADGCWTFERVGFWRNKTVVRTCKDNNIVALFKESRWSNGGTIELHSGQKYQTRANRWNTDYEILNEKGEQVLRLSSGGVVRLSAAMIVSPGAARLPEVSWMVMLCFYQLIMMEVDESVAAL